MKHSISCNLRRCDGWVRLLYMVVIFMCYCIAKMIVGAIAVFQIIMFLFTRDINASLRVFGKNLSSYHYQVIRFLTFNTETRPFPFSDWPNGELDLHEKDENSMLADSDHCDQHCSCHCGADSLSVDTAQDSTTKQTSAAEKDNSSDQSSAAPVLDVTMVDDVVKKDVSGDVDTASTSHNVDDVASSTHDAPQQETSKEDTPTVTDESIKNNKKDDKDTTVS